MTLTIRPNFELSIDQAELVQKTMQYERASLAKNTRRTYSVMWSKFDDWCKQQNLCSLPASAETISLYLASLGGKKSFSTIDTTIAAIEKAHEYQGVHITGNLDLYRRVRKGIRRTHKEKQTLKQARALSLLELTLFCRQLGCSPLELRDKALITIAFFGALRRSELVELDIEHVELSEKGLALTLLQTKTSDQAVRVYLAKTKDESVCPVKALKEWLTNSNISRGPIFRPLTKGGKVKDSRLTGHAVSEIMKKYFGADYSGHSLRRGLVTSVAEKGAALHKIQQHSRHKTANMVLRYIEYVEGFENASAVSLGA
jgi:site-specific recombinase XerD